MNPAPPSGKTADWSSDDAGHLRNFLSSPTGERMLIHLGESVPELLAGGDVNSILIRSGEVKGGSALLSLLVSLTTELPKTTLPVSSDKYPDLDDDSAWEDSTPPTSR